jgi:hypothetical protein
MKLDDLFNRSSRRQQKEYEAFRESLISSSVSSPVETKALLNNLHIRTRIFVTLVVAIAIFISFFMPELKGISIVFTVLILVWILAITLKGKKFILRYIKEEFSNE